MAKLLPKSNKKRILKKWFKRTGNGKVKFVCKVGDLYFYEARVW